MPDDSITIVRTYGPCLAKRVHADGTIDDYDQAKTFDLREWPLDGLGAIDDLLSRLCGRPDLAVVRGAVVDPARTRHVRRLLHPDRNTGEAPTLRDIPRRWVAIDVDGIARPPEVDVGDIGACGEIAVRVLPPAFHQAAAIIQATASHGLKPGIRLRPWYWLDRPVSGAELKFWFRTTPVDPSTFRAVQLIYTSGPSLAADARDPLPVRFAWRGGGPYVAVPPAHELQPPSGPKPRAPLPEAGDPGSGEQASTALVQALVRVRTAPAGRRNPTLFAAACRLAPLIRRRLLDEATVIKALTGAGHDAGIDADPHRDAAHEAAKAVAWALEHVP
jgi:hypothetical protein